MLPLTVSFPYAAAACDIDGTILDGNNQLSAENQAAVRALQERPLMVVLATGRNFQHTTDCCRRLGLNGPVVSSDGALVSICGKGGEIISERPMPRAASSDILQAAARRKITCLSFFRHGIYATSRNDWNQRMEGHREIGRHFRHSNVEAMTKRSIYKMLLFSLNQIQLDELFAEVAPAVDLLVDVIRNGPNTLEFVCKGVSKASGLELIARRYNLAPRQFVAFGDGANDVEMFRWAGLSVCMNHGHKAARDAASMVAPPGAPETNFAAAVAAVLALQESRC